MPFERWLYVGSLRLRSLFRRSRVESELDEEMRNHLERQAVAFVAKGLSPEDARFAALRAMGGIEQHKEECRDTRRMTFVDDVIRDVHYAARMLRRSPAFTAVAVLSLALGIGANTAIFSVIDALLLRTLPVGDPEQLVALARSDGRQTGNTLPYPTLEAFRRLTEAFADITAISVGVQSNVTVNGRDGGTDPGPVVVSLVSGTYFSTLGVNAAVGRTLTADDDRVPGGHPVAVLSDGYRKRRFAFTRDVVGRTFALNGTTYTVVGVTPAGFVGDMIATPTDLWLPIAMEAQVMRDRPGLLTNPTSAWTRFVARLKPGVTRLQAQAAAQIVFQRTISPARQQLLLLPAARGWAPQREFLTQPLTILLIVVGLVLLVACSNVANLLLARSAARQRELAVPLAIGASRARLVRQLLTESLLLAAMGGGLGLVSAVWATRTLVTTMAAGRVQLALDIHPDVRVFSTTVALSLLTAMLFGLVPAFRGAAVPLTPALSAAAPGIGRSGRGGFGLGKALVMAQVALSLVLLIGAGLFVRTLRNLQSQDVGFDRERVLFVWMAPSQAGRQGRAIARLFSAAQERIALLPGVVSASPSSDGLLSGFIGRRPVSVTGHEPRGAEDTSVQWNLVAPRFFETTGMRFLVGRDFTDRDTASAPRVAIVNETMTREYFPDENPIGKRFTFGQQNDPIEIVGVVQDAKYFSLRDEHEKMVYIPYLQDVSRLFRMCLAVRTAGDSPELTGAIREALRSIDPDVPVVRIDTGEELLTRTLSSERLVAVLSGFFGVLALLLACIGLYGLMSYLSSRRTSEIGIRAALGATRAEIRWTILRESLMLVLVGTAIGVPAAVATMRFASSQLFGIGAADPLTIAGATVTLIVVATAAAFIPADRASRVDPMVALRCE